MATAATLGLALASTAAVRIFLAEWRMQTVAQADLERAVRLAPGNADAWARLGALRDREGDAAGAAQALAEAVRLNPFQAPAWIDLGLHWELEGDVSRAERCLLQAVRADRSWAVQWALVNFYLRQGRQDQFWSSLRDALQGGRTDLDAAFDLCWRASQEPAEILQKGIPDAPEILRSYFRYLLDRGRKPGPEQVWLRLAPHLNSADLDLGLRYTDQLLEERRVAEAVQVWNGLSERRLLPFPPLDLVRGRPLVNGQFRFPPSGRAFDWRLVASEGIVFDRQSLGLEGSLRIRFSGAHAEEAALLWQWVPVLPDASYRLGFRYRTDSLPPDSGLVWTAWDDTTAGQVELGASSPLEAAEHWSEAQTIIRTRRQTQLIRLVFRYRRSEGTTRATGSVSLAGLRLTPLDEARP
jgi:tetratricopeptide (TPR) repeat protein